MNKVELPFFDKVVIITGASSGIGKATAIEFAKQGAKVVLAARSIEKLNEISQTLKSIQADFLIQETDVRQVEQCKLLIDNTIAKFGKIDVLINNAGLSMRAGFADLQLDVLEELMQTNFWGAVYCSKFAFPYLIKNKGSIVAVSSISGLTPLPGRTGYAASKHAMDGFFNSLRVESIPKYLHILVIHPSFTQSNIRNAALNKDGQAQHETPRDEKKMMSSEEVAVILVKAVQRRTKHLVLGKGGKALVWFYKHFPNFTEKFIYNQMSKEPNAPF